MQVLARWLESAAARTPAAPALIEADGMTSYAELWRRTQRLAAELARRGVAPGDLVAAPTGSARLSAMLAWSSSCLGCPFMPLDPAMPAARREALLEQAGVDWVVGEEVPAYRVMPCAPLLAAWENDNASARHQPLLPVADTSLALVIATSGSEGRPKGVMLSDANLAAAVRASRARLPLAPGEVWLACLPLFHVGGLSILYRCAEAGAAVLLQQGFDVEAVRRALAEYGVSHVSLVPAMLARLVEAGPPPVSLKYALIGGGPLSAALMRRATAAGWPACPSYGLSEAASQAATLVGASADWAEGTVGPPLAGLEVELETGSGRIRLRGPMVMAGYVTPRREFGIGLEQGWFATGDSGYHDADGNLVVRGRVDDMLVSGGRNVHPCEVESLLAAHPQVRDAAVIGVPDEVWGDRLAALVVGGGDLEALRQWCRDHLPGHLRPRLVVRVQRLPRNAMGKLERGRLRDLLAEAGNNEKDDTCYSATE